MKKIFFLISVSLLFATSCSNYGNGELVGVLGRPPWYQPDPYGTLYIPMGSYNMGPADQDVPYAMNNPTKTVSVQAFYMDQTEITNNEYRQFVYWVRDSLAYKILGEEDEETYLITVNQYDEDIDPPLINWDARIYWDDPDSREALSQLFLPENERFYRRKQLDTRKLMFEYYWIDLKRAADRSTLDLDLGNGIMSHTDRSQFIVREVINVYPDTLAWVRDFTYSFNEPMTNMYFWHPAYDNYPVVGVNWKQATAFCIWRTELLNNYLRSRGEFPVNDFRLPTEAEWEWAARGGLDLNSYPWGSPYIRNTRGCFLGNFKPLRGNYIDDGGFHTVHVYSYAPNDFGLYCMAGNVAEWTSNAFDPSAYSFSHDLNMDYRYNAKTDDPPANKRKVIRGGSWKDVGYYLQVSTRTYEYQDTAKCYIGFRCVMTYLGRAKGDQVY